MADVNTGLTVAKLRAAQEAMKRMTRQAEPDTAYFSRDAWIMFGADPEVWDSLPTVDKGDGVHGR